jgi:hypothetical protein
MKTRLIALGAICFALLFALLHSSAHAAGSGDPRIAVLQSQVRALQTQVKTLQTSNKAISKVVLSDNEQIKLSFSSQTCLAAEMADLFEGTWGVIDQVKPTFGPQTQVNDFGNCADLAAFAGRSAVVRGPVAVPPTVNGLLPLITWLHE